MSSTKSKLRLIGAFAALAALALAVSCRGFFVNPTLTSISVGPLTPTIETGSTNDTVQMFAVGTFNDGSSGSTPVTWSVSGTNPITSQNIATITGAGLVTAAAYGTGTITASSTQLPSISGTQALTVTLGCIQSITIKPSSGSIIGAGNTTAFTAEATTCNGSFDITTVATWSSSNTQIATVSQGTVTAVADGSITISASSGGVNSTNTPTVTISGI
ncbi:MAG: Ig-like domain-containing protein [Candidatus Sulfotelmatobacter sp.]